MLDSVLPLVSFNYYYTTVSQLLDIKVPPCRYWVPYVAIIFFGCVLSSLIGTTGAAIVVCPLLAQMLQGFSDVSLRYNVQTLFIISVCNSGGLLLPTGDPVSGISL